ncbi:hypothetical protein PCANC_07033 [Puccinia coronata f. sp. avenae]|uniref:Uncharacterized protein n=1 Tax=Puccinia coronata f. sp. avenae TaxID=200324 RepID=A0A2N5VZP1_9BASI|nr:hypothetical protein PCANC_07033 [Puccinia coronata f. sp. avenae]
MDSLHPSLSQALPLRDYDAEQALQAPFRAAALGIATFYKKASENGRKAYSLGYSSALQDLLAHLQTALDQLDSQHSQESMACTIQRIVDYIQRRQEALRAESQEPNEEDAVQPSSACQHTHRQSTTPPSHNTLSHTDHHPHPAPAAAHSHQPTSSSNVPRSLETASSSHLTRRRTSPRRMTPVTFQPTTPASSSGATFGVGRAPSSPSSASGPSSWAPFNLNFSSFAAVPLPQHHPPSNNGTTTMTTASSGRRHRGALTEGRKGKVKERSAGGPDRVTASSTQDSSTAHGGGYAHYGPSSSSSSADSPRPLALLGTKRRYPTDSSLAPDLHLPAAAAAAAAAAAPLPLPPQPLRITRRSSNLPKPISAGPTTTNASPATPPALDPHFSLHHHHHHHHHDQDDVLMVLQGPGPGNDDGIERASKRFLACKNRY